VLATLHASNTYQSMERLVSIFSGEKQQQLLMMLSMNLIGMLAQRLVPKVDGGRAVATELLVASSRVKDLIRANQISDIGEVLRRGEQEGVYSFDQNLYELYAQGLISEENALGFADNRGELKMRMKGFQGSLKQV
jgi:twitching motility protein PilU